MNEPRRWTEGGRPLPVIVDTDGGVDDATALWWTLESPRLEVVAITCVHGNVSMEQTFRNVAKLLHAAGRTDIPVARGAAEPLGPRPRFPFDEVGASVHGDDGLGGRGPADVELEATPEPAHELINRLARERPGELVLCGLGPATNIALALRENPDLTGQLRYLIYMSGLVEPPGNVTPVATFNVGCDPLAAYEMFEADWPWAPLLLPFDTNRRCTLKVADLELADRGLTPAARFLAAPLREYHRGTRHQAEDGGCGIPDVLTTIVLAHPEVAEWQELPVTVDIGESAAWGMTVFDLRGEFIDRMPAERQATMREELFGGKTVWNVARSADRGMFRAQLRGLFGDPARE
jgi:purine nucleosidase